MGTKFISRSATNCFYPPLLLFYIMNKTRLEAFSDGVLAIIITIMVLEIKIPHTADWNSLIELIPVLSSYVLSFLLVGIYWGNHHNLLHGLKHVTSGILLANLHLLFWLSLVPFATGWMGENHFAPNTIIVYAIILSVCGIAYTILQVKIVKTLHEENELSIALKKQSGKAGISLLCCLASIPFAYVNPIISGILFFIYSAIWLIPDTNIEKAIKNEHEKR